MPKLASEELLRRGDWTEFVNQPLTEAEVEAIRRAIRRGRPFGSEDWIRDTAKRLGLEFSLRCAEVSDGKPTRPKFPKSWLPIGMSPSALQ